MKKQGKVKSVSIKFEDLKDNLQVIVKGHIRKIKTIENEYWLESVGYLTGKYSDYNKTLYETLKPIKTLVIEYDIRGNEGEYSYEKRRGLPPEPYQAQIPLKFSQWENAIKNGEVESDKTVSFEISRYIVDSVDKKTPNGTEYKEAAYIEIAKIIPTKQKVQKVTVLNKVYSTNEVKDIVKQIIKEADYLDFTPEYGIKGWSALEKALNEKL